MNASVRKTSARPSKMPLTISRPEMLVDGSDHKFRALVHGLFGLLARHEAVRAGHAARIGLAGIEYTVLIAIGHLGSSGAPVGVNRLADHLFLSGSFVTTVTNKLLKLGLVSKTTDPADRRKVCLSVTEKGYKLLAELAPFQRRVNDEQFSPLKAGELEMLLRLVSELITSSESALKLQQYLSGQEPAVRLVAGDR